MRKPLSIATFVALSLAIAAPAFADHESDMHDKDKLQADKDKEQLEKEKLDKDKDNGNYDKAKLDKDKMEKDKLQADKDKEKLKIQKISDAKPGWKNPNGPPPGFDRQKAKEKAELERKELQAKLAEKYKKGPSVEIKAELTLHAQRIAELNRISELAAAKGDQSTTIRVTAMITRENSRHDKRMHELGGW